MVKKNDVLFFSASFARQHFHVLDGERLVEGHQLLIHTQNVVKLNTELGLQAVHKDLRVVGLARCPNNKLKVALAFCQEVSEVRAKADTKIEIRSEAESAVGFWSLFLDQRCVDQKSFQRENQSEQFCACLFELPLQCRQVRVVVELDT